MESSALIAPDSEPNLASLTFKHEKRRHRPMQQTQNMIERKPVPVVSPTHKISRPRFHRKFTQSVTRVISNWRFELLALGLVISALCALCRDTLQVQGPCFTKLAFWAVNQHSFISVWCYLQRASSFYYCRGH